MAEKLMASIGTVRKAVSTIVSPDLSEIKTELKVLNTRMGEMDKRLTSSIDSLRNELRADTKVGETNKKLDVDRRVFIMEAKMKELEKRS